MATPIAGAQPDPNERLKLAVAIVGLAVTTLVGLWLFNALFPFIAWLKAAYGLLGLLLFLGGLFGAFVAFLYFLVRGKRAAPHFEGGATIESLDTRQP